MVWFKCPGSHYIESTDNSRRDIWCAFCRKIIMKTACKRYRITKMHKKDWFMIRKRVDCTSDGIWLVECRYPDQRKKLLELRVPVGLNG